MPYHAFRIVRAPQRVSIKIPLAPAGTAEALLLNHAYPMAVESEMKVQPYLGFPGEPLDDFVYQIQATPSSQWSKDIIYVINVSPAAGTPACAGGTTTVSMPSETTQDISEGFIFPNTADRFKINSVTGVQGLMINGSPVIIGQTYMRYDAKELTFSTVIPFGGGPYSHATISYTVGNKTTWAAAPCSVIVDRFDKAYIEKETKDTVSVKGNFFRTFHIGRGIPQKNVLVKVINSINVKNFTAEYIANNTINEIALVNGTNLLTIPVSEFGTREVTLSGSADITDFEKDYYLAITCELVSSDNSTIQVDSERQQILFEVYNNPDFESSASMIDQVLLSSVGIFGSTPNRKEITINTGTDLDLAVDIQVFYGQGQPPYTYLLTKTSAFAGTVAQDGVDANKWTVTDMPGSPSGNLHTFQAKVTDAQGNVSIKDIWVNVKTETVTAVPVITAPVTILANQNALINTPITATNSPTSYGSTGLPSGLTIVNGRISGSVATPGVYTVTLTATNGVGVSTDFTCTITIVAQAASIPNLTSDSYVEYPFYQLFTYQITHDTPGGLPVTIQVTGLPHGWYFSSLNKTISGEAIDGSVTIGVRLTNSYGTRLYNVTIVGTDIL